MMMETARKNTRFYTNKEDSFIIYLIMQLVSHSG